MNRSLWVITYDISTPKRYRKIFALLKSYGRPVQYSVFECRLSETQSQTLISSMEQLLDLHEDRVHCYPVCGQCDTRTVVLGCGKRSERLPDVWIVSDDGM